MHNSEWELWSVLAAVLKFCRNAAQSQLGADAMVSRTAANLLPSVCGELAPKQVERGEPIPKRITLYHRYLFPTTRMITIREVWTRFNPDTNETTRRQSNDAILDTPTSAYEVHSWLNQDSGSGRTLEYGGDLSLTLTLRPSMLPPPKLLIADDETPNAARSLLSLHPRKFVGYVSGMQSMKLKLYNVPSLHVMDEERLRKLLYKGRADSCTQAMETAGGPNRLADGNEHNFGQTLATTTKVQEDEFFEGSRHGRLLLEALGSAQRNEAVPVSGGTDQVGTELLKWS